MILSIVALVTILKECTNNSKGTFLYSIHTYPFQVLEPPPPNWKIDPFLEHLIKVSIQSVHFPEKISYDKQTVGFTGKDSKKYNSNTKRLVTDIRISGRFIVCQ